jgi:2-aminoadipate transaminase
MLQEIDRESRVPLYQQIREQLRTLILAGDLPKGIRLPPERELARSLGVNRTTVSNAYQELAADGYVEGHVGRGTIVCAHPLPLEEPWLRSFVPQPLPWGDYLAVSSCRDHDPLIRQLLELCSQKEVISLAGGVPATDLLPVARFGEAMSLALRRYEAGMLQLCPTEGHPAFRQRLAERAAQPGIRTTWNNVLILAGSQQGLDLVARTFIEPGDTVIVETPTFLGALNVFRARGARLIGVSTDHDGMNVDVLDRLLARYRPRLIYTLPTFQNPSGAVMSLERRKRLLALAQRYQVPILEDDPYGELYYGDPPPPSIKSLDQHGHVIYLSTFSKIFSPGIRIGWVVAPRPVIDCLASSKQYADLHSNTPAQLALCEFIERGWLDDHLAKLRTEYAKRLHAMAEALDEFMPNALHVNMPKGGFYLWCHLRDGLLSRELFAEAASRGVAIVAGEPFHADRGGHASFRLNFTYHGPSEIREGIRHLGAALYSLKQAKRHQQVAYRDVVRPVV